MNVLDCHERPENKAQPFKTMKRDVQFIGEENDWMVPSSGVVIIIMKSVYPNAQVNQLIFNVRLICLCQ